MSEKIYAWLLKLYPVRFREDYATSALQLFRDRMGAERGFFRRLRFWLDVFIDLVISLPREHWRQEPAEPAMEGSFHISEEAVTALMKRGVVPAAFVNMFVAIGLAIGWLGHSNHVLLFAVYLPLAIVAVREFPSMGRHEEHWRSYQLILETDRLQQKQHGREVTLLRSQVVKINEDQYGLWLFGFRGLSQAAIASPMDHRQLREQASSIWIPAGLTGYQHVREQVLQWTDRISRHRSLWLEDLKPVFICAAALLPAMLLVHSLSWFLIVAAIYYGMVLLAWMLPLVRPLQPPARTWRRFKRSFRKPPLLVLLLLPMVRIVLPL